MKFLYLTADRVGIATGGGTVTHHESEAMRSLALEKGADLLLVGREQLGAFAEQAFGDDAVPIDGWGREPWTWDGIANLGGTGDHFVSPPKLAHVYAGTFTETVASLKRNGCRVCYTAAAHDIVLSRREHEKLGIPYDYPHLNDPEQWERYVGGYLAADVLVCPSQHSADVMRGFGAKQRIEIIPHGCDLPERVAPFRKQFTVGYLGAAGPDKGLVYLLQAWKRLDYPDATLVLAGRDSTSPFVRSLIERYGGGNITAMGWVRDVSSFYDSISLYCQPSITEGYGCEVLEAMAHGRPVLCSTGAGAADVVPESWKTRAGEVDDLVAALSLAKNAPEIRAERGREGRRIAEGLTWPKIEARYKELWKEMLR